MNEGGAIRELPGAAQLLITAAYQLESPVQVAKELLDNALDAGATEIELQIGPDNVTCQDNGAGFTRELLERLLRGRITTKGAGSFGFRGEALYLISRLARVVVESNGLRLDGELGQSNVRGTRITAAGIFHNVPVRQRYFQQTANFQQAVRQRAQLFEAYAVAFDASIKLVVQGAVRFNTFGRGTRLERFSAVFGGSEDELVAVTGQGGGFSFEGRLSSQASTRRQNHLFAFVNRQFVVNPELYAAVTDTYRRYNAVYRPSGYVFIDVPAARVSFNCSSDKLTVKLMGAQQIAAAIRDAYAAQLSGIQERTASSVAAVAAVLEARPAVQPASAPPVVRFKPLMAAPRDLRAPGRPSPAYREPPSKPAQEAAVAQAPPAEYDFEYSEQASATEGESSCPPVSDSPFDGRYVGQYNRSFLLLERQGALLVADQHALDEAVRFERLCDADLARPRVQPLINPCTLPLSPHQEQLLRSRPPSFFARLGFDVDLQAAVLRAVPVIDGAPLLPADFVAFVDALQDGAEMPPEARARLANRACKSAVKLGDALAP